MKLWRDGAARNRMLAAVGIVALIGALAVRERVSLERANRLHREREWSSAADIYRARLQSEGPPDAVGSSSDVDFGTGPEDVDYNLGTTLLALGSSAEATGRLNLALRSPDAELRARTYYNLGVGSLRSAIMAIDTDSAHAHARIAVEANRSVLRLSPGREDAVWNLALAQHMLDSLDVDARRSGLEAGRAMSDAELVQSDPTGEGDAEEVQAPPGMTGEEETVVDAEGDVLSLAEAAAILASTRLDGELITRKLLALAGRSRFGSRMRSLGRRW